MQTLKKSFIILSMAALLALGTAALLPSPALAACTPAATSLDDFIVCDGNVASSNGLAGNDTITNYGNIITINGNPGNDIVNNYGFVTYLYGDDGHDIITNYGEIIYLYGNDGNDILTNYGYVTLMDGGLDNDIITNYGGVSRIEGNEGNDIITNYGLGTTVEGNAGNDIVTNYGEIIYLYGHAGNDIITNYGDVVLMDGGLDNDILTNYGAVSVIDGNAGNDIINNYGEVTVISGGFGNDNITNYGIAQIIADGFGNDTITNNGVVTALITTGPGDDTVILGRVFVMSGLVDGASDFDTLKFDTVGDTRADVRTLLQILADNKGEGTLTWHGETFSWVNFEALTGNARYRSAVVSDGLIRVTETLDSLLIIGLDKGKINLAVPVNFTRLKHVTDGQTIADFTDNDGYNLQLSVLSADDNLWTVYYYSPDGALISSYNFEFDPIW